MARKAVNAAALDAERIANAALALVTEKGLSGFTIRALAKALGVTPMALYYHVGNKATLAQMVVEAHERVLPPPALTGDWREDLWAAARWAREGVVSRPAVQQLHIEFGIWSPAGTEVLERWISLWQQSGLDRKRAALASAAGCQAIVGMLQQETAALKAGPNAAQTSPDAPSVPVITATADVVFELAVRSLIDGLHARLMQQSKSVAPPSASAPRRPSKAPAKARAAAPLRSGQSERPPSKPSRKSRAKTRGGD